MSIKVITNAKIVHERGIIWNGALVVDGKRIAAFGKASEVQIPSGAQVVDAGGAYVGPGFVDIHVHGGDGHEMSHEPALAADFFLSHG